VPAVLTAKYWWKGNPGKPRRFYNSQLKLLNSLNSKGKLNLNCFHSKAFQCNQQQIRKRFQVPVKIDCSLKISSCVCVCAKNQIASGPVITPKIQLYSTQLASSDELSWIRQCDQGFRNDAHQQNSAWQII
jgi:hypothetical protein